MVIVDVPEAPAETETLVAARVKLAVDELVEVPPQSIRLRKRHLKAHDRKRASREETLPV